MRLTPFTLLALALALTCDAQTTRPTPPKLVIGVWAQPIDSFIKWKGRGINTVVGFDTGRMLASTKVPTKAEYEAELERLGLFYYTPMGIDLAAEAKQPYRLGWILRDEPDLNRFRVGGDNTDLITAAGGNQGWATVDSVAKQYNACKLAAPNLQCLINFAGPALTNPPYQGEMHKQYLKCADVWSFDFHIFAMDRTRYWPNLQARCYDRLTDWSGYKPGYCYVEISNQQLSDKSRAPTPDEVEDSVGLAIGLGSSGIIYFAHNFRIGWPGGYDGPAIEVGMVERVTAINDRLGVRYNGKVKATTLPTTATTLDVVTRLDAQNNLLTDNQAKTEARLKAIEEAIKRPLKIVPSDN